MTLEVRIESELYGPTRVFLHAAFADRLAATMATHVQIFAADTSVSHTSEGGHWSRPDLAALILGGGEYVPYWKADLHTFEVKTCFGVSEGAVHEANAHGRFGHYTWLVFQALGKAAPESTGGLFRRLCETANRLGVGLIHFADPSDAHNWTIAAWPRRTGTDNATADAFVRERFPAETQQRIKSRLEALGWRGAP
jgi:hypothetical protein